MTNKTTLAELASRFNLATEPKNEGFTFSTVGKAKPCNKPSLPDILICALVCATLGVLFALAV